MNHFDWPITKKNKKWNFGSLLNKKTLFQKFISNCLIHNMQNSQWHQAKAFIIAPYTSSYKKTHMHFESINNVIPMRGHEINIQTHLMMHSQWATNFILCPISLNKTLCSNPIQWKLLQQWVVEICFHVLFVEMIKQLLPSNSMNFEPNK